MNRERLKQFEGEEEGSLETPRVEEELEDQEQQARETKRNEQSTVEEASTFGIPEDVYKQSEAEKLSRVSVDKKPTQRGINFDFVDAAQSRRAIEILNKSQGGQ